MRKLAEGRSDLAEMVRQFTKWSVEVTHPEQVPGVMRRAFQEAKSTPTGPVFVGFAANALDGAAEMEITPSAPAALAPIPNPMAVEEAARLLASALKPVMIVGDRVAQAGGLAAAVALAERLGAGVYATSIAQPNFPTGHPQFLGRINPTLSAGRQLLADADVVLAVGANVFSGFFYVSESSLGAATKLIHLDSAQGEIGKTEPTDVAILGNPKAGMEMLAAAFEGLISETQAARIVARKAVYAELKRDSQERYHHQLLENWTNVRWLQSG